MNIGIGAHLGSFPVLCLLVLMAVTTCFIGVAFARRLRRPILVIGPVAAAAMVGAAMLVFRLVVEPGLVADEQTWHRQALLITDFLGGHSDVVGTLNSGKEGYPWIVGTMYHLSAPAPILPIALGVLLLVLSVPLLGAMTSIVVEDLLLPDQIQDRAVRIAMYLVALSPTIAFWAPRMLRETPSMFLISVSTYLFLLFLRSKRFAPGLMASLAVLAMASIRGQIGVGIAAGLLLGGVLVWTLRFPSWITRVGILAPMSAALFAATWLFVDSTSDLSLENTALRNASLAEADSAFDSGETARGASSYADIVLFNLPRVLAGPFPFELSGSGVMILAAVSNVFWLAVLCGAVLLFTRWRRVADAAAASGDAPSWRSTAVLLTVALTLIAILSINAGNYGIVVRMRLMPLAALISLAAVGFSLARDAAKTPVVARQRRPTALRT